MPVFRRRAARAKFEVYRDRGAQWRWRLKAANGRIVADSSEGYTRRRDARRAAADYKALAASAPIISGVEEA